MASQNDTLNLNVFFVVDERFDHEDECSDDMWHAYNKCDELDVKPSWVQAQICLKLKPGKTDIFVIDKFEGEVFEYLQQFKSTRIVGPRLLIKCFTTNEPLPGTNSPVLNSAMDKIVVSVSGFSVAVKEDIRKKVEYMGGVYTKSLKGCVTHLVTNTVMSAKYEAAIKSKLSVVQDKWVYEVWEANLEKFVAATDPRFDQYKCPIFLNLCVTTTNVPVSVKEKIKQIISSNGGSFSGALDCTKVQVVLTVRDGDNISKKIKCAQQKGISCLAYEWIFDSVKAGSALALDDYMIKPLTKCSSPKGNDGEVSFASINDLSRISCAGTEYNSIIQETINTTAATGTTSDSPPEARNTFAIGDIAHVIVVDKMSVDEVKKAGPFLDGCSIYLIGFTSIHREKLNKILSYSGATRLDDPTESLTHVIVGDLTKSATEIKSIQSKDINPFIVNVKWLQESIRLRKPAFEDDFLIEPRQKEVPKKKIEPASPLSKKNLAMLSKAKPSPLNNSIRKLSSTLMDNQTSDNSDGSDLVMKYLQAEPVTSKSTVLDNNSSKSSTSEPQNDQSNAPSTSKVHESSNDNHNVSAIPFSQDIKLFQGLTFTVSQYFSNEETQSLVNLIKQNGGRIVSQNISADFSLVPIDGPVEGKAKKVVSELFIDECLELEELVEVQYFHEPITLKKDVKPLKDCVISLTSYNSSERRYLEHLSELLGAKCQNTFAKSTKADVYKNTHLICANTQGKKYTAAIKWKIPAVSSEWLLTCAEKCEYVNETPFLVGESKLDNTDANPKRENSINCTPNSERPAIHADDARTPKIVNKILNNVKGNENVIQSPFHVDTPTSPYGRCFMNNPTRSMRKELKKWVDDLPDYNEPPAKKRRQSTPLSEIKRKLMEKCVKESEVVAMQYASPVDQSPTDEIVQDAATRRKLSFAEEADPLEEIKKVLKNASDLRESLSGESSRQVNMDQAGENDKYISDTQRDDIGWDNEEREPSVGSKVVKKKFMLSGTKDRQLLENIITTLGGEVSHTTDFDPDATHLVCLKPGRNEKLLGSIAGGKWVLHVNYILDSEQNEAFLNEESYEFGNPLSKDNIPPQTTEIEQLIAGAAYKWRTKLQETPGGGAFKDMVALLLVMPDKYDQFKRLILAGGGVVVESRPPYDTTFGGRKITHCFVQPKQLKQPIEWASLANKGILCFSPQFLSEQLTSDGPLNPRDCVVPEFKKYLSLLPS